MKSKFYIFAVAVIMAAVFSGCKEKPEEIWLNEGSVTTDVASEVTVNSAKLQGAVYPLEAEVTEMGFYYDTTREMFSLQKVVATDGFSTVVTGLEANTTYYYYAYATAYGKTKEGDTKMFKTASITAPVVETLDAMNTTLKGNLISDGGSTVTALGFVYGTDRNNLSRHIEYSSNIGIGGFSCTPTGLSSGATYYYRAYAVNSVDTAYGAIKSFCEGTLTIDFETGDFSQARFSYTSNYPWIVTTTNPYEGRYCMKSSNENQHSTTSYIELAVNNSSEKNISFYLKVSSESNYDKFTFYIDNVAKSGQMSGDVSYRLLEYTIPQGSHTLKWEYRKNSSGSNGNDCAYVDKIIIH